VTVVLGLEAPAFSPQTACWVCGGTVLRRFHQSRLDFREYARQDPALAGYSDRRVWIVECRSCGFGQPEELPRLPRFFERMYDQHWADEWIAREFEGAYKDLIFRTILRQLDRRVASPAPRRLLDVGAHAGRFMSMAQAAGWEVEGIEVNPRTAAHAEWRTGAVVHRVSIDALAAEGRRYGALTLTDVLEHIPDPVQVLASAAHLIVRGGVVAVKVPSGPAQRRKEQVLSSLDRGRPVSLADNLVHVNHFSAHSLRLALERAGFRDITIRPGAPELRYEGTPVRLAVSNALRLTVYAAAHVTGVQSPAALNLQAYARRVA
jgi:2-polyprenyl-3-methyl-5-hydroxy-6-metoxy-1,4-benzoquinol methylase